MKTFLVYSLWTIGAIALLYLVDALCAIRTIIKVLDQIDRDLYIVKLTVEEIKNANR